MSSPQRALEDLEVIKVELTTGEKTGDNPSGITIKPYTFSISKSGNEQVGWHSKGGVPFSVNFEFPEGSPFYESVFSDTAPLSGLVRRDIPTGPATYRYSVTIGEDKHNTPSGQVDP